MKIFQKVVTVSSVCLLAACVSLIDPNSGTTYQIDPNVTRTDAEGNKAVLTQQEGWKSTRQAEAAIPRLPTWLISKVDSSVAAERYGFASDNNYQYIDPVSPILQVNRVSDTGWITYLVTGNHETDFVVKRVNFKFKVQPEIIGTLEKSRGEWKFTTTTGQIFAAHDYQLTSRGILLFRSSNVFTYLPNSVPQAHILPAGWSFAWSQKADIEASRLIMIKQKDSNSLLASDRYMIGFYDIDQGKILDTISMNFLPNVEQANFENRCYLYDTTKGPISIAMEDDLKHVTVRNIRTGQKKIAFERDTGISRLHVEQQNTGRIAITAAVGFKNMSIYDVEDFMYSDRREFAKLSTASTIN